MIRVLAGAIVLALLAAPLAGAHLAHERPHIQGDQARREVHVSRDDMEGTFEMLHETDPLRDHILHKVDASKGLVSHRYREQPPIAASSFDVQWRLTRFIEYRDVNENGLYEPGVDAVVRSWRPSGYSWTAFGPQAVRIGDVNVEDIVWFGTASQSPRLRLEAAAPGRGVVDEGARVRPQDVILYFDLIEFPPRGLGDLYALEGDVTMSAGAAPRADQTNGTTTGILVEAPGRLAFFDWGGQATIDGKEVSLPFSMTSGEGNATREFRLHVPIFEKSIRFVIVAGVEYARLDDETPAGGAWLVVAAALVALAFRRR